MKPEELDELFRRGLADQQLPPRPSAWAAVQQRLAAAAPTAADEANDDLPAFLRSGAPVAAPAPRPVPLMTASRGGAALPGNAAAAVSALSSAWWQRPALRAAAAVVLLIGGGALLVNPGSTDTDTVAPDRAVAVAPATAPPAPTQAQVPSETADTESAAMPVANVVVAADAGADEGPAEIAPTPRHAPTPLRSVLVSTASTARSGAVPHRVRRAAHVAPESAPVVAVTAPKYRPALDSQATRAALAVRPAATLTVGEAADATLATNSAAPTPHGFVNVRRADLSRGKEDDEMVEVDGGTVGQLVARAAGRPVRIASPNALLRRGAGRMLELLDRADHTVDGQLTIETSVVGRPVRKTISL